MFDFTGIHYLMNSMYNMTQSMVSIATEYITASHLVRLFIEGVLLKVGLCYLIVVDIVNKSKGAFIGMAKTLCIKIHIVASRNHKSVGVGRYHKCINHATTVLAEEQGSTDFLINVECYLLTHDIPIGGLGIIRSIPAIGRELTFPFDINIDKISTPIDSASKIVAIYLQYVQQDTEFSQQLIE